jgi:hypothetical protein
MGLWLPNALTLMQIDFNLRTKRYDDAMQFLPAC